MSTIKFVPMEFFAQFALTQMRRLQARGAVGGRGGAACGRGALPARLFRAREHHWRTWRAVGGRRSLFVRLSRRRVPIVNAGRCRRGFPGAGTSLADVGRCLRAWGAVGAAFSSTGTSLADVESCWWAQVAVCTAFPAQGAYCERWALSARLSGSGNIVGRRGELLVGVGALSARLFLVRGRRWWAQVAACGHEALSAGAGCCRRGFFEHGNIIGGCGELLVGAGRCLRTQKRRWRGFFRRAGAPPRLAHAPALPRGARCLPLGLPFGCTHPSFLHGACSPPARWTHTPALPRGARCLPLGLPFGCTSPALPPRRVPLRRLTFPHKDATIISLFAAAWPSAEHLTGCGAVW